MVITIIIAVSMAGAFALGFFCALKAVQLGLKWKIQTEKAESPTTPAQDSKAAQGEAQAVVENANVLDEWVNGKREAGDEK